MGATMVRQVMKDSLNRIIGWREPLGNRVKGCDAIGRLRGWYDPKTDETRDDLNRLVGRGDMLAMLILGR